ncbi:MAG TPA: hypothetical protein PLB21_08585, partial [Actinomycetota bacterium]|nr:hypothetical protein [Actinomycetota bacterium]
EVGETVPLLQAYVRHSESSAHDCRYRGQLAHELAADVDLNRVERLKSLSARRRGDALADNVIPLPVALSGTADSLAGDYDRLAVEICARISAAEAGESYLAGAEA